MVTFWQKNFSKVKNYGEYYKSIGMTMPVATARKLGMKDFVKDVLCVRDEYAYTVYDILDKNEVKYGGYIHVYKNEYFWGKPEPELDVEDPNYDFDACLYVYDIYLCSDGRIRCKVTEETEKDRKIVRDRIEKYWSDASDLWYKENGFEWNEEIGCYVNNETGEELAW